MSPDEIKEARRNLGLNQNQMASMLGYTAYNRISEFETGKRKPPEIAIRLISAYIDGYRPADWPEKRKGKS